MAPPSSLDDQKVSLHRLWKWFDTRILGVIRWNVARGISIDDRGDIRIALRKDLDDILNTINSQINDKYEAFKFSLNIGEKLFEVGEIDLGLRCTEYASTHFINQISDEFTRIVAEVNIMQYTALCEKEKIMHHNSNMSHISPRMVSQLLDVANTVEDSLTLLFENFSNKNLEKVNHIVLNGVQLLYEFMQPLIWWNCGKYVTKLQKWQLKSINLILYFNMIIVSDRNA